MKKIIFLITFLFLISFQTALADENNSAPAASPTPTPVEYQLPYPGLLPDSPLYPLKMIRDRIIGFLISDPLKKAEFNLLQADKRLNGAFLLLKKSFGSTQDKQKLVISTLSKGGNYFEEAIIKTKEAKKQGIPVNDLLERLSLASKKHQDLLKEMERKISKENKEEILRLQKRVVDFEKEVNSLRSK